ncbi:hypothetical protein FY034_06235 [Trichlorobacter lovleyi]|uniref:GH39 family glycosyl hydrolase n=1 Tax=Trichlorobacter lovleyi TaxID=313985 RepID=UPI00223EE8DE|nr:hypothetical protein [Trichlorobacter lovleyi]QOX78542.1 hypothetical protein FY034_06235 [Trichlorobacter lovleyi]
MLKYLLKIIVKIHIALALFLFFPYITSVQAADLAWHRFQVGFNLGYPDRVHYFDPALKEIERLGVRNVRIYEVFDGQRGNEYQVRLKKALDIVLKYNMHPLINISNFHARLQPHGADREQLTEKIPLGVRKQLEKNLTYTNRFPPSDLDGYRSSINEFISFLFNTYGKEKVQTWLFEIGNEPDAALYFWGSSDQFAKLYSVAVEVLKGRGIHNVGGAGTTQHPVFMDDNREATASYNIFMKKLSQSTASNGFLSFHCYERLNVTQTPLEGLPRWLSNSATQVFITEWNVSSRSEVAAKTFAKPGAWGASFIYLLADCANYGVDRLYLFDLMDYAPQTSKQAGLGIFDRDGKAKSWYRDFTAIFDVVRDGYRLVKKEGIIILEGRNGQRIFLPYDHELVIASPVVYAPDGQSFATKKIQQGGWIIVSDKLK